MDISDQGQDWIIGVDIKTGDSIDYFNTRSGRVFSFSPQIEWRVGKHFKMNLRHNYEKMDVDGGRLYSTNLTDLRFTHQFTIRSSLRVTVQYSDTKKQSITVYVLHRQSIKESDVSDPL